MHVLQHKVVSSLPVPLQPNSIYYVRSGTGFDQYVTNSSGVIVAYPANPPALDLAQIVGQSTTIAMSQKAVTDALNTKANTSTQVIAGTGLSGGGNLFTNRTLSVNYGTTAGTAAQGNDSRITGAAQKSANLSDLASASAARQNLGLGTSATRDVGTDSGNVMEVGAGGWLRVAGSDSGESGYPQSQNSNISRIYRRNEVDNGVASSAVSFHMGAGGSWGRLRISELGTGWIQGGFAPAGTGWTAELIHTGNIRTTTGQSTQYPMTQKAVTDAINNSAIGVGQTWQDVTSSRSLGTTYTNATGRPIQLDVSFTRGSNWMFSFTIDGVVAGSGGGYSPIIPHGSTYRAAATGISDLTWRELR